MFTREYTEGGDEQSYQNKQTNWPPNQHNYTSTSQDIPNDKITSYNQHKLYPDQHPKSEPRNLYMDVDSPKVIEKNPLTQTKNHIFVENPSQQVFGNIQMDVESKFTAGQYAQNISSDKYIYNEKKISAESQSEKAKHLETQTQTNITGNNGRLFPYWGGRHKFLGLNNIANDSNTYQNEPSPHVLGSVTQRNALLLTLDPKVRRKIEAAHVYFLDYYFDHLVYIRERQIRFKDFENVLIHLKLPRSHLEKAWSEFCKNETTNLRKRRMRTREREFDILAQIGQGGYGRVFLARKRDTGEVCALKKMSKRLLFKLNEVQHILTERDILRTGNSAWLVKLLYAFQDKDHVFLAMEYVPGGDVRTLLNTNGILMNKYIRFYSAEMFVAVAALHTLGFVHRDLKPENFMIDGSGHVKLTDFGLSQGQLSRVRLKNMKEKLEKVKDNESKYYTSTEKRSFYKNWRRDEMPQAYSIVGSPDYMAPEILYTSLNITKIKEEMVELNAKGQSSNSGNLPTSSLDRTNNTNSQTDFRRNLPSDVGYDHRVDYWSLGCIVYEFGAGYAPFTGQHSDEVWRNVYYWEKSFQKPEFDNEEAEQNFTNDMWDLITKLVCHKDERISSLVEAQSHEFFRDFNMAQMRDYCQPPFVPELESEVDTSYFDDFSSSKNLDLYREVIKKQDEVDGLLRESETSESQKTADSENDEIVIKNSAFAGFTFRHTKQNRFI
ncbi:hypothetical protein BB558_003812 [Smittium angustum]|uniref:non-specific serine/threonine protein kinase n=1 Tax=Smittium angustum TaxID=133377 RepID=A0A2U1J5A8_SMIAN|nr:hypothetical protein BB558_003812 [Smittium angustum]